ncbi:alpha-1,3-mannosyl-glycoprotein 2-beta-N-acetylglucosaminyltransferase [Photinus pyralis]|uniref:Alpha-1,3-mannosyl-glycoprotein 2-beta-N-acetylglucosaminyltransferase n=2 Tax=Photinus pyralis TaxID=7054 RepID=A0A1Y1L8B4_PHOPY|nr:alpha-1,3-mannosyl-glycoprotein 2-beta-N-acetylglucosaminyltransferase [Photinus pyralis]
MFSSSVNYNMRMRRTYFLGFSFLIWILIIYITVKRHTLVVTDTTEEVDKGLKKLENGILEQFKINKNFISTLHSIIEAKKQDVSKENEVSTKREFKGTVIPVVVIACNRVSVNRCLDQLIQYRPNPDQFPIIVSQDCNHAETTEVIERYGSQVLLIKQPDQSEIDIPPKEKKFKGYFKIARHYGWALNQTFFNFNFDVAIIVEDDLNVAPDFFEYFSGTYPLLLKDPSLWCISAWNDNGKVGLINQDRPDLLYRSDFFPGLGWMLTKSLWVELCNKWPRAYWDDWIRSPEQRKDRACIRPEVSRTRTFGKIGVSNGLFFEKHLKYIKLNEVFVPFTKMNLSYLMKDIYDSEFVRTVYQSAVVSYQELKDNAITYDGSVRIIYHTRDVYKRTAKLLGLMDDFKSGVPRTGYKGIVTFNYKGRTVYLTPSLNWKGYDPTWS